MDAVYNRYTLQSIPSGAAGTRATLKLMAIQVKKNRANPRIRELGVKLVSNIPNKDWVGEVSAIQEFVKNHIRYTKDIFGVETIQSPSDTLRLRAGDCDDHAILVASLLNSIGHPARFLAVGFRKKSFAHVLTETKIGGHWLSVETTEPVKVGWLPQGIKSRLEHNIK